MPGNRGDDEWSVPHFEYQGIVASLGRKRIRTVEDLPSEAIRIRCIKAAAALNENGVKVPRPPHEKRLPPRPPADLVAALGKTAKAKASFEAFTPSRQREYVEWMAEGKTRNWKYIRC